MEVIDSVHIGKIAELLTQRIGLNSESVGRQTLQHAIHQRMAASRSHDAGHYFAKLQHDPVEWREFIEEMIVPESWFFREVSPFECARLFAQQALKQENPPAKLRFLSVPCSRGEEPYSLSMTLLDAGLLPKQFEIVACDLSARSLSIARRGSYRAISFREEDPVSKRLTSQYFQQDGKEWELNCAVRDTVSFREANLAASDFLQDETSFDMILCRNLMIYLTDAARRIALGHFKRLLAPHGLLYLGHSECRIGSHAGLASWNKRFPAAFTLAKSPTVSELPAWNPPVTVPKREAPWPAPKIEQAWSRRPAATPARATSSVSAPSTAPAPQRAVQTEAAVDELSLARGLANRGRLQEAEALCQRLQLKDPYNADLLCLLGVIQQAYGNMTLAESCYQKALFVSPNHEESLTHLMLLHQLRGESAQAMNYQRRLDLAKNRGS